MKPYFLVSPDLAALDKNWPVKFCLWSKYLYEFGTEPSKELRSMLCHLLDMMPVPNVSGPGRDSALNLLVKQVPRKSLKNPDNSLTLWVIDQGMKHTCIQKNIKIHLNAFIDI